MSQAQKVKWSYLFDWGLVAFLIATPFLIKIAPYERYISEGEVWFYRYPLKSSSYPAWALLPGNVIFPVLFLLFCQLCVKRTSPQAVHHAILGFFAATGLTWFITDVVKIMIGRPRPDFLERCFDYNIPDPIPWREPGFPDCTGDPGVIAQGRMSFPSGHSSLAFSSLTYLTLFLADFVGVFDADGHPWKLFVCSIPTQAALLIAASRVSDYWHHATDVIAGSVLGAVIAFFAYRQQRIRAHYDTPTGSSSGLLDVTVEGEPSSEGQ